MSQWHRYGSPRSAWICKSQVIDGVKYAINSRKVTGYTGIQGPSSRRLAPTIHKGNESSTMSWKSFLTFLTLELLHETTFKKIRWNLGPYLDQYGRHPKIPLLHGIFEIVTRLRPVLPSKTFVGYTNYHMILPDYQAKLMASWSKLAIWSITLLPCDFEDSKRWKNQTLLI